MTVEMLKPVFQNAWTGWGKDQVPRLSAALTFYVMLALSPLVLLFVSVAGFIFGTGNAKEQILNQIRGSMGDSSADFLATLIAGHSAGTGILATVFGFAILIFGASGVFEQLRDSMNAIWRVEPQNCGFITIVLRKITAVLMVLVVAGLLISWLGIDAYLSYLHKYKFAHPNVPFWEMVSFVVGVVFWSLVFAVAYRFLPAKKIAWRDVGLAAFLTALLFTVGKYLLSLYFAMSAVSAGYGSAGAIVLILLWVYYNSQIFFLGAEVACAYAHEYGSLKNEELPPETHVLPSGVAKAHS